ncbi:hypothetical protein A2867_03635 [Candidatus Daviesbacteria bacterium RIFCSPHIGHO2_01_FULL_40_11]|uniref:Uncharacterized protein n=1 Tax=Candidatus Daviesbacteria bacterium RIFCSPHIGHO2_01_FULL_40_11 TaxID=1797762 RepID=A0A1F5JH78_9BACT|nr:MAG: hypothetical protein A2867_03635 [Candidatus Daviesbacteria bacterium RIFCSPHIGHO2_01_FULL_40_11]OGE62923.1 MAG: hypothetical protein A2964_01190 [Candidatus Daviesbacteria bacterium RIFCSPLOWO2_01_FULL_40_27]
MIEKTISRRELFGSFSSAEKSADKGISVVEGNIVIPNKPLLVPETKLSTVGYLAVAGALTASKLTLTRRDFLRASALVGGSLLLRPERAAAEEPYQIVPMEYERSLGWHRSYPWLPVDGRVEGEEATGFNEGGPWDKYDALDRILNGRRARSVYWQPTRDWLISVAYLALLENNGANSAWSGYCMDAAAAAFFAPRIEGPISVLGIDFTERDRLVIATMRWGGLAREMVDTSDIEDIKTRVENSEAVVVNHSTVPGQDWWGLVREVQGNSVVITRILKWDKDGLQTEYRHYSQLRGAYSLQENRPQPGFEGNFAVVDRTVGGLIVGTHQLVV